MARKTKSKKSRKSKKSDKKMKVNTKKVITDLVAGEKPKLPKDRIFNLNSQRAGKASTYLTKTQKLRAKYVKLGYRFNKETKVIMPPQNVPQRVSAKFLVEYTDKRTGRRGRTTLTETRRLKPDWFEKFEEGVIQPRAENYDWENVKVTMLDTVYKAPALNIPNMPLGRIRMREAKPLLIEGFEEQGWNKNNGQCVIDFLHHYYADATKSYLSDENFDVCFYKNWREEGVCAEELENLCQTLKVDMIALDIDRNVVRHRKCPAPSKKLKSLIYVIHNEHLYPIVNTNEKKSIQNKLWASSLSRGLSKHVKEKIQERKSEKDKLPVKVVNVEDETTVEYLCKQMLACGKQPLNSNIEYGKTGIDSYILNGEKIVFETPQNKPVIEYFESIGKEYKGESLGNYVTKAFENMGIVKSSFNSVTREILNTPGIKNIVHRGLFHNRNKDATCEDVMDLDNGKYLTMDINKCHTYLMKGDEDSRFITEWIVVKESDEFVPYKKRDEVLPGLYWVETKDTTLFNMTKVYTHEIVAAGLEFNIISHDDIKMEMITSTISGDYFDKLIDEHYPNLLEDRDSKQGKLMLKSMNNATSGMLGRTHRHKLKKILTSSEVEAQRFILENNEKEDVFFQNVKVEHEGEERNFIYAGYKEKIELDQHNLPMYLQILCCVNVLMHKHMLAATAGNLNRVVYRNIDSFTFKKVEYEEDDDGCETKVTLDDYYEMFHNPSFLGQTKIQPNPKQFMQIASSDVEIDWKKYKFGWKKNNKIKSSLQKDDFLSYVKEGKSALVQGLPGAGKSLIIKHLDKHLNCLKITASNVSARGIGGETIHSMFGYDGEKVNMKKILDLKDSNFDVIIIDEYSIIQGRLWNIIHHVKKELQAPILGFGDYKQLKPVGEDKHYFNNSMVKQIFDCNLIELEYHSLCRMSPELLKIVCLYRDNYIVDIDEAYMNFKWLKTIEELPFFNICYTNEYRIRFNRLINQVNYQKFKNSQIDVDESSELFGIQMHSTMPLMCVENLYKQELYNGQRFIVQDFDNDSVSLEKNGEVRKIDMNTIKKSFVPAYVMTNHKIIGITCNEDLTIHEHRNTHLSNEWHIVVLSRARDVSQISYYEE
jgi:hypothetical protein